MPSTPDPTDVWLDIDEVCTAFELQRARAYQLAKSEGWTSQLRGGRRRWLMSDIQRTHQQRTRQSAPLNPDCRDGKHAACRGDAWDITHDELTPCTCSCHGSTR